MTATPMTRAAEVPLARPRPMDSNFSTAVHSTATPLTDPLRLRLRAPVPDRESRSLVDGAWWPYSDDLITELEPLLIELARRGHAMHRVSYSLTAWHDVPRKLQIAGTLVRLSGYRTQPTEVIHLMESSRRPPLVLVVVPPTAPADVGAKVLHLAVTNDALDAAATLAAATA